MRNHPLWIGLFVLTTLVIATIVLNTVGLAQPVAQGEMMISSDRVIIMAGREAVEPLYIPPPAEFSQIYVQTASFSINWLSGGDCQPWLNEAKTAFQYAANIWGALIQSSVPIRVDACWKSLGSGSGILGGAGPYAINANFTGAPRSNTWYPGALANALAGYDLSPTYSDIYAEFNSAFSNWHFDTGSSTPSGKYNFVSVALHELAHGLGFISSLERYGTNQAWWGWGGENPPYYAVIMDRFIQNGAGQVLIDKYPNANITPSAALFGELTNNNLWFNGYYANQANGGTWVKLYAPGTWMDGSSVSHLDYNTYKDTANRLMVYALSAGVTVHDPGPVTRGIFRDLGWNFHLPTPTPTFTPTPTPSPLVTVVPAASGGTIQVGHETTTTLQFPSSGLPCDIRLTVSFTDVLNYPINLAPVKPGLKLDAVCVTNSQPVYTLSTPLAMNIRYDNADIWAIKENTLMIYYWNSSRWITATETCSPPTTFNRNVESNQFDINTCNMGRYALMGKTERTFLPITMKNSTP